MMHRVKQILADTKEKELDDDRRRFVQGAGTIIAAVAAKSAFAGIEIPDKGEDQPEELLKLPPQVGDRLTPFARRKRGETILVENVPVAAKQIIALPFDKERGHIRHASTYNQLLIQRFDDLDSMDEATAQRAAAAEGIVVYSAICTHQGCIVISWDKKQQGFMCPCHQTVFDPRNSGDIVSGPAPRRLPSLPVIIESGEIVIAGDFDIPVGIGSSVR